MMNLIIYSIESGDTKLFNLASIFEELQTEMEMFKQNMNSLEKRVYKQLWKCVGINWDDLDFLSLSSAKLGPMCNVGRNK